MPRTHQVSPCPKDRCSDGENIEGGAIRHNGGPILFSPEVPVDRPPTEHEYFQCSMQMLRSYLTHVRFSPHGQANLVSLKNSLHLSHWMCAASYNLVNRHHSTVKSHLDMVIRVIRNRVHELKFLKPSRLNQRCDGDELRDFDNACFEAFVTFAQDHFTYLKDNEDLHLVLCVISGLAWTEIEERLVDDEEKEKEDWKEVSTAVEAAEDSQVATPQPLQEEWQCNAVHKTDSMFLHQQNERQANQTGHQIHP